MASFNSYVKSHVDAWHTHAQCEHLQLSEAALFTEEEEEEFGIERS